MLWLSLPPDIKILILVEYLGIKEISSLARINSSFRALVYGNDELTQRLWKSLYRRDLSEVLTPQRGHREDYITDYYKSIQGYMQYDRLYYHNLNWGYEKVVMKLYNSMTDHIRNVLLDVAVRHGHVHIVEYMMSRGMKYTPQSATIEMTARYGHLKMIQWHVQTFDDEDTYNYILDGAVYGGHFDIFKMFYHKTNHPSCCIDLAIRERRYEFFEYAQSIHSFNVDILNEFLAHACRSEDFEFVRRLIECGANDYFKAMKYATKARDVETMRFCMARIDPN